MGSVNSEIIHLPSTGSGRRLKLIHIPLQPDEFIISICLANVHAGFQFIRREPACFFGVEGMFWHSFDSFTTDYEFSEDRIGVVKLCSAETGISHRVSASFWQFSKRIDKFGKIISNKECAAMILRIMKGFFFMIPKVYFAAINSRRLNTNLISSRVYSYWQ